MYTVHSKKTVMLNILDILKKYSDAEHRLTQAQISDILSSEYGMKVDRRTVRRNLSELAELYDGIDYTEVERRGKDGSDLSICTDWYIEREFDDSELRLLIDSVLFAKNIPYSQSRQLIDKLAGLSNVYFGRKIKNICGLTENMPRNPELFHTIDVLDTAISENKKVAFIYNSYGADKKLHPKRESEYIINPYRMAATNGRYYLICNYDKYDNIVNYRIDRITGIRMLDETRKPISKLREGKLDMPRHMAEHIYMYAGDPIRAVFKAKTYIIDQVIDWFGMEADISQIDGDECIVRIKVNEEAFFCWAMQYGLHIEVLEPQSLRERVISSVNRIAEKYRDDK
ncbi:MAG TPA: WYL domain-containing protein [Candidatus Ornithomonoglobus merdipullorum]|uniref:WYL domain-containing protein n=1 Tax=Candidatus Ornithomonoglobus merdipullorum TaxID=2840895 RepID=A0A9D1SEK8_9FIRM|nr:WYL domain-containing protein [Candidatus Ornithomonoglobus merdipullorum]